MSLNGKHALITGSSRGIGRGIALKLAASGAKVAIHYFQNEAAANDTLGQVRKRGSDGLVIQADVRRPEQIIAMFGKVQAEFGKLDIFVSNARTDLPTVNGISPGGVFGPPNVVEGGVLRTLPQDIQDATRAWHEGGWTPMRRLGTPEDIGNAVTLLCMEEAGFITGQIIHVDGGASIMDTVFPLEIQRG